jgi:methylated-DNA-protein-cysteine methyltransferase related protein
MDDDTVERVRAVVLAIPPGETLSYGEVARLAGLRSPRLVGRILAIDGHDLPWHRVLRADGTSAPHIAAEQHERLRAEGVFLAPARRPTGRGPRSAQHQHESDAG